MRGAAVLGQDKKHESAVTDATVNETVVCAVNLPLKICGITRIGEFFKIDYRLIVRHKPITNEIRPNESRPISYKNCHVLIL